MANAYTILITPLASSPWRGCLRQILNKDKIFDKIWEITHNLDPHQRPLSQRGRGTALLLIRERQQGEKSSGQCQEAQLQTLVVANDRDGCFYPKNPPVVAWWRIKV